MFTNPKHFSDLFSQAQKGTKRPFVSFRGGPKNKRFKSNQTQKGGRNNFKQDKTNSSKRDFRPIGGQKKFSRKK